MKWRGGNRGSALKKYALLKMWYGLLTIVCSTYLSSYMSNVPCSWLIRSNCWTASVMFLSVQVILFCCFLLKTELFPLIVSLLYSQPRNSFLSPYEVEGGLQVLSSKLKTSGYLDFYLKWVLLDGFDFPCDCWDTV